MCKKPEFLPPYKNLGFKIDFVIENVYNLVYTKFLDYCL